MKIGSLKWSSDQQVLFSEADGDLGKIHPVPKHRNLAGAEQSFSTVMLRIFSFIICHAFFALVITADCKDF